MRLGSFHYEFLFYYNFILKFLNKFEIGKYL